MGKLEVRLLKHTCRAELDRYLRLYSRSFNPDERVSPRVLRWVIQPSPARVNPVHLFAAYLDKRLVGGACTLVLPMFQVVFGSYIFVDPALRGRGLGERILREVLRQESGGLMAGTGGFTAKSPHLQVTGGTSSWSKWASAFSRPCGRSLRIGIRTKWCRAASAVSISGNRRNGFLSPPC